MTPDGWFLLFVLTVVAVTTFGALVQWGLGGVDEGGEWS